MSQEPGPPDSKTGGSPLTEPTWGWGPGRGVGWAFGEIYSLLQLRSSLCGTRAGWRPQPKPSRPWTSSWPANQAPRGPLPARPEPTLQGPWDPAPACAATTQPQDGLPPQMDAPAPPEPWLLGGWTPSSQQLPWSPTRKGNTSEPGGGPGAARVPHGLTSPHAVARLTQKP